MRAVIVASGRTAPRDQRWLADADMVIAADAGAAWLDRLRRTPDLLVGDLDSAEEELVSRVAAAGARIERHPLDKDASDTELAVEAAVRAGAGEIVLLGATGGDRLDHELANLLLLIDLARAGCDARAVVGPTCARALLGGERLQLAGRIGDLVTLLAVGGDATGVTAIGLRWPLDAATLRMGRSRGLSNVVVATPASVQLEGGALLVVETESEGSGR